MYKHKTLLENAPKMLIMFYYKLFLFSPLHICVLFSKKSLNKYYRINRGTRKLYNLNQKCMD